MQQKSLVKVNILIYQRMTYHLNCLTFTLFTLSSTVAISEDLLQPVLIWPSHCRPCCFPCLVVLLFAFQNLLRCSKVQHLGSNPGLKSTPAAWSSYYSTTLFPETRNKTYRSCLSNQIFSSPCRNNSHANTNMAAYDFFHGIKSVTLRQHLFRRGTQFLPPLQLVTFPPHVPNKLTQTLPSS